MPAIPPHVQLSCCLLLRPQRRHSGHNPKQRPYISWPSLAPLAARESCPSHLSPLLPLSESPLANVIAQAVLLIAAYCHAVLRLTRLLCPQYLALGSVSDMFPGLVLVSAS